MLCEWVGCRHPRYLDIEWDEFVEWQAYMTWKFGESDSVSESKKVETLAEVRQRWGA